MAGGSILSHSCHFSRNTVDYRPRWNKIGSKRIGIAKICCKQSVNSNILENLPYGNRHRIRTSTFKANIFRGKLLEVDNIPSNSHLFQERSPDQLCRVLLLHCGGTLGMSLDSYEVDEGDTQPHLKTGTGGIYKKGLQPGKVLADLLTAIPELSLFADIDVQVLFNRDSSRFGPSEWVVLGKALHAARDTYDAFLIVHGTDTMSYTASALSFMLAGFGKPIVLTGSQLPLAMARSDARQNLIDSITCATSRFANGPMFDEVAICFGGKLLRGNRAQKTHTNTYAAFESLTYPPLAVLGVEVAWREEALLHSVLPYQPRFNLDENVIRVPIVPGSDPRKMYGDLYERGVRGIVLEAFGVGNMPDTDVNGWIPWLKQQAGQGLKVYLSSQCLRGELRPELYRSGSVALSLGAEGGPQMTAEAAVVKMMLCLANPELSMAASLAGELGGLFIHSKTPDYSSRLPNMSTSKGPSAHTASKVLK